MVLVLGAVVVVCVAGWVLWDYHQRPCYEVVYLPWDWTEDSIAVRINDQGQVAGYCREWGTGFLWDAENGPTEFGGEDGEDITVFGLNNVGQVVGIIKSKGADGKSVSCPFVWGEGQSLIRLMEPSEEYSAAVRINDEGLVAGMILGPRDDPNDVETGRMFVWDETRGVRMVDEVKGRWVSVEGLNESGEAAGTMLQPGGLRGFVWSEAGGLRYPVSVEYESQAWDIDRAGNVLGMGRGSEDGVFVWNEKTGARTVGTLGGNAAGYCQMNDRGDIVAGGGDKEIMLFGKYKVKEAEEWAFVRMANGRTADLGELFEEGEVFYPRDINNDGWIVGSVYKGKTSPIFADQVTGERAVLLRPK